MKAINSLGWLGAALFIFGSLYFGLLLDDYKTISQTVSEIGREGSPFQGYWQVFGLLVGLLLIGFGLAIIRYARIKKYNVLPGVFVLFYGLSQFFIAVFPAPHALHNVFGLSMTIGYLTPLVFALSWKDKLGKQFRLTSWVAFIWVILGIFLNLSPLFAPDLYPLEYYGIVQRFLLYGFYVYLAFVSLSLSTRS